MSSAGKAPGRTFVTLLTMLYHRLVLRSGEVLRIKTSYSHMNWQPQTLRDEKKAIPSGLRGMMQLAIQEPCGQSIAWGTSIARGI